MIDRVEVGGVIKVNKKYTNRDILKAYTYTKPIHDGVPEVVPNYYNTPTEIWLPRNLKKFKKYFSLKLDYKLTETEPIDLEWASGYALYDYQEPFVDTIVETFKTDINCLAQAFTRFGKSISAIGVIERLRQKTIILVDKTLLVNQFIEDGSQYSTVDIGLLDKSGSLHDVTVTTFQFLNANPEILKAIKDEFGMVIVDELHVSAANTYKRIIQSFPVRYRLGLTATPTRSADNLTGVLTDLFGEVAVVGKNPNDMTVEWYNHKLSKSYKVSPYNPSASYNKFYLDLDVTKEIIEIVLANKDRTIMIATPSKKVQNHYEKVFNKLGITSCTFNSELKNKKLQDDNMQKVKDGDIKLFTGLNVMLKGVSIPRLSLVLNLMSISSEENLTQLLGRLKTKLDGKPTPLFININPKWDTFKTGKITELLEDMDNVSRKER